MAKTFLVSGKASKHEGILQMHKMKCSTFQCPVEALGYLFLMESWGNSTFWVLVHLRGDVFAAGVTKPLPLLHLHLCWWFPELPSLLLTQGLLTHVIWQVIQSALYTGQFYISSLCTMILLFCQGLLVGYSDRYIIKTNNCFSRQKCKSCKRFWDI